MQFTLEENIVNGAVLKVIGVGGGGGNAVDHMVRSNVEGVDFVCANTDAQALRHSSASTVIQLGKNGLGAGANPEVGREAALEEREDRKSTRLNSSHVASSYAVFCLKKKTTRQRYSHVRKRT